MNSATNDRPIVIAACPRSGTTLLQLMLSSHPRIAIPPETRFVLPTYRRRLKFGDLERPENRRRVAEFICRPGHRFKDLGLDKDETRERILEAPPTIGSALGTVFRAYSERFDRPRWGDKWPAYHRYLEVVMRLFPDAQVVHIVRDPRDSIASLKRMPWWNRSIYHSIAVWALAVEHTDQAMRRWPGVVTRVQYERLVSDPEAELRMLTAALGEDYDPKMAEPDRYAPQAVPERKHWHSNTLEKPSPKPVGTWRTELEPWEVALTERVLGRSMGRFGYERSGITDARLDRALRYYHLYVTRKITRAQWVRNDRKKRQGEENPVGARLTSGQLAAVLPRAG